MKIITVIIMLGALVCLPLFAISNDEQKNEEDEYQSIQSDRDNDGLTDYRMKFDSAGTKVYEELDFNYDGEMDDFYYYSSGVLSRREIDTNYDGKVDVWVYIHEGVYIKRYERDLDFDGEIDQVKDFSEISADKEAT